MPMIEKMFAYVMEDPPGEEGVMAVHTAIGWLPLTGADMERMESIAPYALEAAQGRPYKLLVFTHREELPLAKPETRGEETRAEPHHSPG